MPAGRGGVAEDSAGPDTRAESGRRPGYVDQVCELVSQERPDAVGGEDDQLAVVARTRTSHTLSSSCMHSIWMVEPARTAERRVRAAQVHVG